MCAVPQEPNFLWGSCGALAGLLWADPIVATFWARFITNLRVVQGIDRSELSAMLLKVRIKIKVIHVSVISASGIYARAISELSATEAPRERRLSRGRCLPGLNSVFSASFAAVASMVISLVSATVQAQSLSGAGAGFESALSPANSQSANFLGQVFPNVEGSASFRIGPSSILNGAVPALSIARNVEETGFEGAVVEDALNFNLGVAVEPIDGLNVSADAWRLEVNETSAQASMGRDWQPGASQLYIQDSTINEFNVDNALVGSQLETNGFDLSASYVWDTSRFGQFTLSTKSTYVQDFENAGGLLELGSDELGAIDERLVSPELQSSMMLSWQFGNHTASAITNYFDSFKDISELDLDEINDLVDNITTFDLQYGYSVKAGAKDRAIISFGIRNLFDEKTAQILNSSTRLLDQNGRVAYGSIKYQF